MADGSIGTRVRRCAIISALMGLCGIHRLAWWLDRWIFPGLESTPVKRPIFIVGMPRSGTTLAHRLLMEAAPDQLTTTQLWETVLAPALCEKYLLLGLRRVDCWVGRPIQRLAGAVQRCCTAELDQVHVSRLNAPEEDFLGLLPFGGCFLKVLAWPQRESVWDLTRFADRLPEDERARLLDIYHGLMVRHLRFRGGDRRYLAKNASFVSWLEPLRRRYPDATLVGLTRPLEEAVPSQLSSIADGLRLFGSDPADPRLVARFVKMMAHNVVTLQAAGGGEDPPRVLVWGYHEFLANRETHLSRLLSVAGVQRSNEVAKRLSVACRNSAGYRSRHRYRLEQWGLDRQRLDAALRRCAGEASGSAGGHSSTTPPSLLTTTGMRHAVD